MAAFRTNGRELGAASRAEGVARKIIFTARRTRHEVPLFHSKTVRITTQFSIAEEKNASKVKHIGVVAGNRRKVQRDLEQGVNHLIESRHQGIAVLLSYVSASVTSIVQSCLHGPVFIVAFPYVSSSKTCRIMSRNDGFSMMLVAAKRLTCYSLWS